MLSVILLPMMVACGSDDKEDIVTSPDSFIIGTWHSFKGEVFSNGEIGYSYERICSDIKDISYLYPGIEFIVSNESEAKVFCAKEGIVDFVKETIQRISSYKSNELSKIIYNTRQSLQSLKEVLR